MAKGMRAFNTQARRAIRARLIKRYGPYCQICLQKGLTKIQAAIDFDQQNRQPRAMSVDHIVALADGGSNTENNMWPTHVMCNNEKGSDYDRNRRKGSSATCLVYSTSS